MASMQENYQRWNRFELKYLLPLSEVRELVATVSTQAKSDPHAGPGGFYKIVSLYYDSPDLRCYWEKIDGEKWRRKLRVRTYGEQPESVFVEIKGRNNQSVEKRRTTVPLGEWERTMQALQGGEGGGVDPVLDEAAFLIHTQRLEPKLVVSYNRLALFDLYKKDVRITIDRNIRCREIDLSLTEQRGRGRFVIPPTMMIVEVKFNQTVPQWLCTFLNRLDAQVQRISKYCAGIDVARLDERVRPRPAHRSRTAIRAAR